VATQEFLYINIAQSFANALARTTANASRAFMEVARQYGDLARHGRGLAAVNRGLALGMRQAVLEAYADTVVANKKVPSYRKGDNRLPGALLEALQSPSMAIGDETGIGFIDEDLLRQTAKHWQRLNFGAEPRGAVAPPAASVRWGNRTLGSLALTTPPSPGFSLPEPPAFQGYFVAPGFGTKGTRQLRDPSGRFAPFEGGLGAVPGQFFIGRPPGRSRSIRGKYLRSPVSTQGILGRRFLDQGLAFFAQSFRPAYEHWLSLLGSEALRPNRSRRIR